MIKYFKFIIRKHSVNFFVGIAIAFFFFSLSWADEKKEGIHLEYDVKLGEKAVHNDASIIFLKSMIQEWDAPKENIDNVSSKAKRLAITYQFQNENPYKKLDFSEEIEFFLIDEFGNRYKQLPTPFDYNNPNDVVNANYPSIYPGEEIIQTIFFEAPIEKAQQLLLSANLYPVGLEKTVKVLIPLNNQEDKGILGLESSQDKESNLKDEPVEKTFTILSPKNNLEVSQGDVIKIELMVPVGINLPDSVFIVLPTYVIYDTNYQFYYEFQIPQNYPPGLLVINVIAKWGKGDEEFLKSETLYLKVRES